MSIPQWTHRRLAAAFLLTVTLLLALTAAPNAYGAPALEPAECPVAVPEKHVHRVRCGVLTVPERRDETSDPRRTIRLPVAVIASNSATPAPDPLVFPTTGGPGGGSFTQLPYFLEDAAWAADERDIILIEQRGDHVAQPSLNCTEMDAANRVFDDPPASGTDLIEPYLHQLRECRHRLMGQGVDLTSYSTPESAADLADLRRAMGYQEWNFFGVSYGARLALVTMREQSDGLRAVILDGAYPPSGSRFESGATDYLGAVRAMLDACAADPGCRNRYPHLERSLVQVLDDTQRAPFIVYAKHPHDRSRISVVVRDTDITLGLFQALYDPYLVRALPYVIDQLARGNHDVAALFVQQDLDYADRFAEGLSHSIDCAEEIPFVDDERRTATYAGSELLDRQDLQPYFREACAIWDMPASPASFRDTVVSNVPTLLTSGGHDPVTPPASAEMAARGLSRHYAYTFPGMGHAVILQNWYDSCPATIAKQFLHDPGVAPDSSCIAAASPTKFLTTDDVRSTPAIYHFNSDVIEDRDPVQIIVLITSLAVLIAGVAYGVVSLLSGRARAAAAGMSGAVVTALAVAVLNVGFVAGLAAVVVTAEPLILAFGIPSWARPLGWVALAAMVASVVLLGLVARAWWYHRGTIGDRVAVSLVLVASISFALWALGRGLVIL